MPTDPPPEPSLWSLYILRCADNSLYTGISNQVAKRLAEHQAQGSRCAKYLRGRAPLVLVYSEPVGDRAAATRREIAVKRLSKAAKEALVAQYAAALRVQE
jgi:putative endonuclease